MRYGAGACEAKPVPRKRRAMGRPALGIAALSQNLKLPSLRVTGAVQLAGVVNSRLPEVVV